MKAKGAKPRTRRRGVTREDYVLEPVYWDAGTARLLPRLIKGRTRGPVFVTHRKPGPGKVIAPRDVCPDTGLVRLSCGQARVLTDAHRAIGGVPGTGWDLHEYRHSGLTRLGKAGAGLPMLMAKSWHRKPVGRLDRGWRPQTENRTSVSCSDTAHRRCWTAVSWDFLLEATTSGYPRVPPMPLGP